VQEATSASPSEKWQKLYFRGLDVHGKQVPVDHQSKLRLPPFVFPDGQIMDPPEARTCPMRHRAEPAPAVAEARAGPANVLLNPARPAATNPALTVALGRIGFQPQQASQVQFQVPARPDRTEALALKRRNWIMDVQARQRLLSPRTGGVQRVRGLSGDDFLDLHYALSRPVIIEGAIDHWPALKRWSPEYLASRVGPAPVEYQGNRTTSPDFELYKGRHKQVMPFDRFIADIQAGRAGNDAYITAYNSDRNREALARLEQDLGFVDEYLTPAHGMMWIGPAGTFTPLHFDLTNNLIAQVVGSKRVVMLPPSETPRLYNHRHVFSAVHDITDEAQLAQHPLARGAQTLEFDIGPGDLLYVPIGWWHQVTALDFSVTITHTNFRWPNEGAATYPPD
jgi:hypothetical protein